MFARRWFLLLSLCSLSSTRFAHAQWASNGNGICVLAGDQSYPASASDGAGGAFVVWIDRRAGADDLYLQRITSTGAIAAGWAANGIPVCTAVNDQRSPAIVPDGVGGVYVAWEDSRAASGAPDIYLQRVSASGTLPAGWPAQGLAVCTATGAQLAPSLALESGAAVVAWEDYRSGGTSDVYAQKVTSAGAAAWLANGAPACDHAGGQTIPSIVGDGAGGAIVAWQDERGADSDVYVQRVTSAGSASWTAGGVSLCGATNDQLAPHAIPDGAGGALLAWDDYRANNSDVYAQRVSSTGAPQWGADGKALCIDLGEQYGGLPITDGAGGAIVPWSDFRSGPGHLYAQRITAAGAISWPANGAPVSTLGDISDPVGAPDGLGGAYFTWADVRAGGLGVDLYAVRFTAAGALASGWPAGGALICNAMNDQLRPVTTLDGNGAVIVSWFDARNVNYDVYSKRLSANGTVDVPQLPSEGLELAVFPNPMRVTTSLRFRLSAPERLRVDLLDVSGRMVRVLVDDEELPAGPHEVSWDGRDRSGANVPSGLYFARLVRAERVEMQRLVRVR